MRHLLELDDLSSAELLDLLALGRQPIADLGQPLNGQGAACYFAKPSARTRNSTEMAVVQLGGHPVYITNSEVGIDERESAEDVARTLACYHAVICGRVFSHELLERMAKLNVVPIVNLLSEQSHPLQAIADVYTILDEFGPSEDPMAPLAGRVVTYVGDANNVAQSLGLAIGMLGGTFRIACPPDYQFDQAILERLTLAGARPEVSDRVADAVAGSDVVYTDTWTSMGQEDEHQDRIRAFEGFQVTPDLLAGASPDAIFMHCLPAHRGEEANDAALDGSQSRIWPQATHRLTAARAAIAWLIGQVA